MTVRTIDTGLDSPLTLNSRSRNLTGIANKFIRFFFTNREVNFLYAGFVRVGQWIIWQSVCFWRITRYHGWLSRTDFDNLRYWSESFLIGQFLAINFLTVGAVDTSLDSPLALNTWSRDLTGITNKFIHFFFTNREVDFLNTRFICISQCILWQGVCFWCIVRYQIWFSRSNFDNLRYRS